MNLKIFISICFINILLIINISFSEDVKLSELILNLNVEKIGEDYSKNMEKIKRRVMNKLTRCSKLIKNDPTYPRYSYCKALEKGDSSICVGENEFPDFCRAGGILIEAVRKKDYKLCEKLKFPKNRSLCIFLTLLKSEKEIFCEEIEDDVVKRMCEENRKSGKIQIDNILKKIIDLWNEKNSCVCKNEKCVKKPECIESSIVYEAITSSLKRKISSKCRVYLDCNQFNSCPVEIYYKDKVINPSPKELICTAFIEINEKYSSYVDGIKIPSGIFKFFFNLKNKENIKIELKNLYCLEAVENFNFLWFYEKY